MVSGRDVPFAGSKERLPKRGEPATILWLPSKHNGMVLFPEMIAMRQRVDILNLRSLGDPLMVGDSLETSIAASLLPG